MNINNYLPGFFWGVIGLILGCAAAIWLQYVVCQSYACSESPIFLLEILMPFIGYAFGSNLEINSKRYKREMARGKIKPEKDVHGALIIIMIIALVLAAVQIVILNS
jgi:hypothetical protein